MRRRRIGWTNSHPCLFLIVACFQWMKNTCYFRLEICEMFLCKCFNAVTVVVSRLIRSLNFFFIVSLGLLYFFYILNAAYGAIMRNFTLLRWGMAAGGVGSDFSPTAKTDPIVIPFDSNTFSDWRRVCHMSWVKID